MPSSVCENSCPSREVLEAYTLGRLSLAALDAVAEHIDLCGACQSSVEERAGETGQDSSLIAKVRESAGANAAVSPVAQGSSELLETTLPQEPREEEAEADLSFDAPPGKTSIARDFGPYQQLCKIREGGMGVVYKGWHRRLHRTDAIKKIHGSYCRDEKARERFLVEGRAIARLRHPHVIQVYDCGEDQEQLYLSMELMEGGTLAEKLEKSEGRRLGQREAAELALKLAQGLQAAHQHKIIHRDLKPSNVLLAADGTPKICDFGLAKLQDTDTGLSEADAIMGTASYMAPEQAEGKLKDVGPRSDIYSLGAVLYEMLAGRPPFKGKSKIETLDMVRKGELAPPRGFRGEISKDLEAVCLRCLERQSADRYATAQELADDLQRWLDHKPTLARPLPWYARFWRRLPKRAAAVVAALAVAAVVAALLYRRPSTNPETPPDPDAPLQEIERKLARGEEVTLIGETGKPVWAEWAVGESESYCSEDQEGTFGVHTWHDCGLLQLLRDPQSSGYRLHAEVRHGMSGGPMAEVGLFAGLVDESAGDYVLHEFIRLAFDDIHDTAKVWDQDWQEGSALWQKLTPGVPPPPRPKGNQVHLGNSLFAEANGKHLWDVEPSYLAPELFRPAGGPYLDFWREITLDVGPDGISAVWGKNDFVGRISKATLDAQAQVALRNIIKAKPVGVPLEGIQAVFNPRAPLGLYVYNSSASFRNVVIKPITQKGDSP